MAWMAAASTGRFRGGTNLPHVLSSAFCTRRRRCFFPRRLMERAIARAGSVLYASVAAEALFALQRRRTAVGSRRRRSRQSRCAALPSPPRDSFPFLLLLLLLLFTHTQSERERESERVRERIAWGSDSCVRA